MYPPTEIYNKIGTFNIPRGIIPRGPYTASIRELRELLGTPSAKVEVQQYDHEKDPRPISSLIQYYLRLVLPRITLPSGYECVLVPRNQETGEAVVLRSRDHSTTNIGFYKSFLGREYLNPKESFITVRNAFPSKGLVVEELRLEKQVSITERNAHDELFPQMVELLYTNGYHSSREGTLDYDDHRMTALDWMKIRGGEHFLKDGKMLIAYLMEPTLTAEDIRNNPNLTVEEYLQHPLTNDRLYTRASIWLMFYDKTPEVNDFLIVDELSLMFK